jgi:hypothetical protein
MESTKDTSRCDAKVARVTTNGDDLKRALNWVLIESIFADLRLHGNVKWTAVALVRLAVFWVWNPETGLVEAAKTAITQVLQLFGDVAVKSYQVLTFALITYTPQLLPVLWTRLQGLMQQQGGTTVRVGAWLPLAVDGSRVSVPRTEPNEQRFCKPRTKRGKKKTRRQKRGRRTPRQPRKQRCKSHYDPQAVGPQLWLTLLWHIGLRLPWCWKLGPSYASERGHLQAMLQEQKFPERTLFCGDAGFVGYDFWRSIIEHGHHFLIRVGGNVRLLKNLGVVRQRNDIVYCWPKGVMKKKQPPLVLRLFCFQDGRSKVFLVSTVLDDQELTAEQASLIYRGRWGVEIQFRSLKQTYGRSKLRSRTPEHAEIELHWSLLGLTMLQLLALKEQTRAGEPAPKTSIAMVLRIVRSMIEEQAEARPSKASLNMRLREAVIDSYQRHSKKKSRNYPRRKEEPSTGAPIISTATDEHKKALRVMGGYKMAA